MPSVSFKFSLMWLLGILKLHTSSPYKYFYWPVWVLLELLPLPSGPPETSTATTERLYKA